MNTVPFPIKSTTQEFIEIEDIDHDIVLFMDGSCVLIISTTAVNFGLLSSNEQEALITQYAGLLNSLSFPIELLIRTQHKDVSSYLRQLEDHESKAKNPKIALSIKQYREFVITMVKEKNVLDKKFYIIIPFSSLELGPSTKMLFGSKKKKLPYSKEYVFERALAVLTPKRDHMLRLLARLGLRGAQLTNEQLALLFFTIYNPTSPAPSIELINKSHSAPFVRDSLQKLETKTSPIVNMPVASVIKEVPFTPSITSHISITTPVVPKPMSESIPVSTPVVNTNTNHSPVGWLPNEQKQ